MRKAELIRATALRGNFTQVATLEVVEALLDEIMCQVAKGERITLPGFGVFEPVVREAHTGRNPQNGEAVEVPKKVSPRFKPGAVFRRIVNS